MIGDDRRSSVGQPEQMLKVHQVNFFGETHELGDRSGVFKKLVSAAQVA
jgi:hypothetical protein